MTVKQEMFDNMSEIERLNYKLTRCKIIERNIKRQLNKKVTFVFR
jgi:hypothetical protein